MGYSPGLFTDAVQTPHAVVHLQEINRGSSVEVLNALFSILDEGQRRVWIDDIEDFVEVARGRLLLCES